MSRLFIVRPVRWNARYRFRLPDAIWKTEGGRNCYWSGEVLYVPPVEPYRISGCIKGLIPLNGDVEEKENKTVVFSLWGVVWELKTSVPVSAT